MEIPDELEYFSNTVPPVQKEFLSKTCEFLNEQDMDQSFMYIGDVDRIELDGKDLGYKLILVREETSDDKTKSESIVAIIHDKGVDDQGMSVFQIECLNKTDSDKIKIAAQKAMAIVGVENASQDHKELPPIPGWWKEEECRQEDI